MCLACLYAPSFASALDLEFSGRADLVQAIAPEVTQHPIATGPYQDGQVPMKLVDGVVQTFVWHVSEGEISTAALLGSVYEQLEAQGFDIGFSCFASTCGGFDFRHAVPVGYAPEMHVDLGNFQYLTATAGREDGLEHIALMISKGGNTGFVHMTLVQPNETAAAAPVVQSSRSPVVEEADASDPSLDAGNLIGHLIRDGAAPLDDLRFEIGASQLSGSTYSSLTDLATFLNENPGQHVVLVGHTDAVGALAGNISLSQARAEAVRRFLTLELEVDPGQVEAQGIGFLAPRASNSTIEGREANRRVEVVLAEAG